MKWSYYLLVVLFALLTTIADIRFFSFLDIKGATLVSSFVFAIIFALFSRNRFAPVFSLSLLVLFSVFTSLPLYAIVIGLFALPGFVSYLAARFLPGFPLPVILGIFLASSACFNFLLAISARDWSVAALNVLGWSIVVDSVCGFCLFLVIYLIRKRLFSNGVIKV